MGIAQRRERQKAEVRDLILSASRRIVLEEGFEALSMRKIAEAIEYAPSTIYLHFESRDAIARELVRQGFDAFLRYFKSAARIDDPWERLAAFGRLYVKFACDQPESYRLIFMTRFSDAVVPPREKEMHGEGDEPGDQAFRLLLGTVEELLRTKRMRPIDPMLGAELAWAAMHGMVSLRMTCSNVPFVDLKASTEEMLTTIRCGLEIRN